MLWIRTRKEFSFLKNMKVLYLAIGMIGLRMD
jgi:hypothetical protein